MNGYRCLRRNIRAIFAISAIIGMGCLAAVILRTPAKAAAQALPAQSKSPQTAEPVAIVTIDVAAPVETAAVPAPFTALKQQEPSATQRATLTRQLSERLEAAADGLNGSRRPNRMRRGEIDSILDTLPDDLPMGRIMVVIKAYSLLGKVPYDWGGKSSALGWDSKWGTPKIVVKNGTSMPSDDLIGLDCSGFVRWCFLNAAGTKEMGKHIGSGTYRQWVTSKGIDWNEARPGDLLFTNQVGKTNHDGIVVQNLGNANMIVIHCAEGKGVVLENAKTAGFKFARRPNVLTGGNLQSFEASAKRHAQAADMADLRYLLALAEWNAARAE